MQASMPIAFIAVGRADASFIRIPRPFSAGLLSEHLAPCLYCCKGLFWPRCGVTAVASVELHEVSVSPGLQPFAMSLNGDPAITCGSCSHSFSVITNSLKFVALPHRMWFIQEAVWQGVLRFGRWCISCSFCDLSHVIRELLWLAGVLEAFCV